MTLVKAQLNGLRMSPRKVRLLVGLIKRRSVSVALDQLNNMTKRASGPLVKLMESAIANAKNNFKLDVDHLFVKDMWVDEGVKLRRFRPKGFGRANPIEKKTSRVNVVLEDRAPKVAAAAPEAVAEKPEKVVKAKKKVTKQA
jgi:large subunit ribosomal protein L22